MPWSRAPLCPNCGLKTNEKQNRHGLVVTKSPWGIRIWIILCNTRLLRAWRTLRAYYRCVRSFYMLTTFGFWRHQLLFVWRNTDSAPPVRKPSSKMTALSIVHDLRITRYRIQGLHINDFYGPYYRFWILSLGTLISKKSKLWHVVSLPGQVNGFVVFLITLTTELCAGKLRQRRHILCSITRQHDPFDKWTVT